MFDAENRDRNSMKSGMPGGKSLLGIRPRSAQHSEAPVASSTGEDGTGRDVVTATEVPAVETTRPVEQPRVQFWKRRLTNPPKRSEQVASTPAPASAPVDAPANTVVQNPDSDTWRPLIDPGTVLMGVVRSRWAILLCGVAGAALGVLVALNTPKTYEAATDLLIDPRDLQIVDREISQSGLSPDSVLALIQNQMRIMTSGNVLSKVVDDLHLEDDPEFNGQGGGGVDLNPLNWLRTALAPADGTINPALRRGQTIENLSRQISVTRDSSTFVVTIWAKAQDPEKAARIANTMSSAFLETSARFQAETAGRATSELTGRLDELRRSVEDAERKVEAFKAENGIVDAQGRLITDDEIVKLNDQLSTARARTAELDARAATVGTLNVDAVVGGILPEQVNSSVLGQLRAQYAALQQEADRLAVRLGPRHPQRLAADVQVRSARDQIAQELRRINSSVKVELSRAEQLEGDLAARLDTLKTRQGDLSSGRVALRELERDASSKRAVYEAYLLRSRETGEQENINTANINIISPATAPLQSSGLSRAKIAILGLLLGLAAGIGLAMLRGVWDSLRETTASRAAQRNTQRLPAPRQSLSPVVVDELSAPARPVAETDRPLFPWQAGPDHPARSVTTGPQLSVAPLSSYAAESARRLDRIPRVHTPANAERSAVDEIRTSLREFREAVDDLRESSRKV